MSLVPALAAPMRPWWSGIGGRLLLAFVLVVGLAVVACMVGWFTYQRLSRDVAQFAESQIPQLALAVRLSRVGSDIGSAASGLIGAPTRADYTVIRKSYAEALSELERFDRQASATPESNFSAELAGRARETLQAIDIAAGKRFTLAEELFADLERLRWIQADLIEEAGPLVDDIRFNIEVATRDQRSEAALSEQGRSEALLSLVAEANLSTGLLSRLVGATSIEEWQEVSAFLGDSADELAQNISALEAWPDAITVRQLGREVLKHADALSGIPNRKRTELREAERLGELSSRNQALVAELGRNIVREVAAIEARAGAAAERAQDAILTGRWAMAAIAIVAALLACLIGYFYVLGNLLGRLRQLSAAAGALSEGRAEKPIEPKGTDELSDLARALALFRQTQDELVQSGKLAALGQMAAGIGHELNQPLSAIRAHLHTASELIKRGSTDRALSNLAKIGSMTGRMAGQIELIRRFARKPVATMESVDLAKAVNEAVGLIEHRIAEEKVELDIRLADQPLRVWAEMVRLEQIIVNLLANALDAVQDRPVRRISVRAVKDAGTVQLSVRDTGSGIAADDLDAVFDPFFTTKPPGRGLGLGLSITYNIVKDFGGNIRVAESGPEGTDMVVTLRGIA